MAGQDHNGHENPLHDYATQASHELAGRATDVNNSSVERVESGQVSLHESFAHHVQASATYMEAAAAGVVKTGALEARDVSVGVMAANTVHADRLQTGLLAARQVEGNTIRTGLLFAVNVRGDVHSAISPLAGLAIGAGFAVALLVSKVVIALFSRRAATDDDHNQA